MPSLLNDSPFFEDIIYQDDTKSQDRKVKKQIKQDSLDSTKNSIVVVTDMFDIDGLPTHSFYSFEDFKKQLSVHNRKYNNFPMRPLNWKSPADYLKAFLINGEVF